MSEICGNWLIAAQNAAQSQNGDIFVLKLIQEAVIFIEDVAYDRLVARPSYT